MVIQEVVAPKKSFFFLSKLLCLILGTIGSFFLFSVFVFLRSCCSQPFFERFWVSFTTAAAAIHPLKSRFSSSCRYTFFPVDSSEKKSEPPIIISPCLSTCSFQKLVCYPSIQSPSVQASRIQASRRPESNCLNSKRPVVQNAAVQASSVQASRVQASSCPESSRPESRGLGSKHRGVQSPSV